MNKQELIKAVAAKHPVKGDKVSLHGLGIFESRERKARECRNPQTGEKMKVAAKKAVAFKAAKALKEALNK